MSLLLFLKLPRKALVPMAGTSTFVYSLNNPSALAMNLKNILVFLSFVLILIGCSSSADSPEEAKEYLLAVPRWGISEVYVNDALSYKDGKEVANFGGINFNRYMESVQFRPNGDFVGQYAGASTSNTMHWAVGPDQQTILVTASDTVQDARSGWYIAPRDVQKDSFEMTTETAAFDYPRVTRIRLKFVAKQ